MGYYGHLFFLFPVMRAAEYIDALKLHAATMGQEETEPKLLQLKKEDTLLREKWIYSQNALTQLQLIRMRNKPDFWNEALCFCPIF